MPDIAVCEVSQSSGSSYLQRRPLQKSTHCTAPGALLLSCSDSMLYCGSATSISGLHNIEHLLTYVELCDMYHQPAIQYIPTAL